MGWFWNRTPKKEEVVLSPEEEAAIKKARRIEELHLILQQRTVERLAFREESLKLKQELIGLLKEDEK